MRGRPWEGRDARARQEIYGADLAILELVKRIDQDWLACSNQTLPFLRADGRTWSIERHPYNDRGDLSSQLARKESVEKVGVVNAARSGWREGCRLGDRLLLLSVVVTSAMGLLTYLILLV